MTALSFDRSTLDMKRGACPALSVPMMTGDGLLARIALTDAISPQELAQICRLALKHGNGMLDISARGNLQVRGLTEASAPRLDADVRAMNLPLRDGLAVEIPPLAGLDPNEIADPRPLAEAIRKRARGITGLAPKMAVVVDGHGLLRHANLLADIRLVAQATPSGIRWKILLGGTEASAGILAVVDETTAAKMTLETLDQLARRGKFARGRDLAAALPAHHGEVQRRSPFALHPLSGDLWAVGLGSAYGQAKAESLLALCEMVQTLGIKATKPALDHSLIFFGSRSACDALSSYAERNGFVVRADDPRGSVAACPGSPACSSAYIDTHSLARFAIEELPDLLDGSFKLHVSGCTKGCAHPQATALTLCGTAEGVALVAGKASGTPFASLSKNDTRTGLHRLAALIRTERGQDETAVECMERLGQDRLSYCLMSGNP